MNFSSFTHTPMDEKERYQLNRINNTKRAVVYEYANQYNLQELISDVLGINWLFYDNKNKRVYKVQTSILHTDNADNFNITKWRNTLSFSVIFEEIIESHVLEMYNIHKL